MQPRALSIVASLGIVLVAAPVFAGNENEAAVTYYKDVLPIVQQNCQTCHRAAVFNISGLVAPMSFMTYSDTRPWHERSPARWKRARCHHGLRPSQRACSRTSAV